MVVVEVAVVAQVLVVRVVVRAVVRAVVPVVAESHRLRVIHSRQSKIWARPVVYILFREKM